jgi:hypothetical protein
MDDTAMQFRADEMTKAHDLSLSRARTVPDSGALAHPGELDPVVGGSAASRATSSSRHRNARDAQSIKVVLAEPVRVWDTHRKTAPVKLRSR